MSHTNGRAGWWKSPCPDLARGRGGQPPGLLYKALWRPRRLRPPPPPPPAAAAPPARPGARRRAVWTGRAGWDRVGPLRGALGGRPRDRRRDRRGGLTGLPPALVIVDENDVLRDEGEAYARRLIQAGVPTTSVRYNAIVHDFMMLNPLRETEATTAAIEQAIRTLRKALGTVG